jgi:tripartite-type tricarboxylate transporter receptor subunit TctC
MARVHFEFATSTDDQEKFVGLFREPPMSFRRLCRAAVPAILIAATASANAQQYPSRVIRVISPSPAGSASDTVTRVVMDQVSQLVGQSAVIEMRPGAGGSLGFALVARR